MWQLFSLGSLVCGTLEETIDKATMVSFKPIGLLNSTLIRNLIFVLIAILGSLIINKEFPKITLTIPIITLGILNGVYALFYSSLLRKIEITTSSMMSNFIPLIFLPIDIFILDNPILSRQIIGIIVVFFGGLIFFSTKRGLMTKILGKNSGLIITTFILNTILFGLESYIFKDLFNTSQLSETSFLISEWGIAILVMLCLVLYRTLFLKSRILDIKLAFNYSKGCLLSKTADFGNSFFFLKALTLSSASQVSSMQSLYPIILIVVVLLTQKSLKINLEEVLDPRTIKRKLVGIAIISLGTVLIR